jgi:L-alanine-DL-glutamate epimerase-like enolase superfamily enzyme
VAVVRRVRVRDERWPIRGSFTISRGSRTEAHVVVVELSEGGATGRGECVPYARYGETLDSVRALIEGVVPALEEGLDRAALQSLLPAGAARNALDCALWDLECKASGERIWQRLDVTRPAAPVTAYTLSLEAPEAMRASAREHAHRPLLKLKLGGPSDLDRVSAVREGAPKAAIIVDANEGWTPEVYTALAPELQALGVAMIEQPLPADEDGGLAGIERPVPVCADESCHDRASLQQIDGRYDLINIKLDKTGGLTEALALKRAAQDAGLGIMVGCMLATSLSMAPALMLTEGAAFVDLDGPLLLAGDRDSGLDYDDARVGLPSADLWG